LHHSARLFHDARPWERIKNTNPLTVLALDGKGGSKLYFVVIAGFGSWNSRGLHFCRSFKDLNVAIKEGKCSVEDNVLVFFNYVHTPFRTLDHIAELGLEISTKDGSEGTNSYPCWRKLSKGPALMTTEGFLQAIRDPSNQEDILPLMYATMAVAKFSQFCGEGPDTAVGRPTLAIPTGKLNFDVSEDDSDVVMAEAECLVLENREQYSCDIDSSEYLAGLSIGETRCCNYCQKRERLVKEETGKLLQSCSRCRAIQYCSRVCQDVDWTRHRN
jgi:hypothetical protein